MTPPDKRVFSSPRQQGPPVHAVTPLQNLAVALAYLVTALLGLLLAFEGTNATAVWPPAGIALAAALLVGYGVWPGVFLGAFLANLFVLSPGFSPTTPVFVTAIGTATGNTLAALCGAYLVRRFIPARSPFDSTPDAVRFILLAAVASPLISATTGTISFSLYSGHLLGSGQVWLTWWLGDAVGVLVFAPLLLTWEKRRALLREKKKIGEAVALLALVVLFEAVVFLLKAPVGYLIFLVLFWTALRFGQFETALTVTLVMLSFLAWTVTGVGPFATTTLNSSLLFLQSYLGVAAISTLLLSTLVTARRCAEENLRIYQENLENLVRARTAELQDANERLTREIEERGRTERNLIEREAQYRDLVESANCVILRWLPDGRITFFNRFAQSFFGYREEEILGRSINGTLIPLQDSTGHELASLAADIVAYPEAYSHNINENMRKNGELVWVAWTNKPIPAPDGSVAEILSIGIDITRLVHTEQELRRTLDELERAKERAESADHLKSAFLATMSHELRTPLNSIIGFTGILLQGLSGPVNEEQVKQLGMVKSSANHLLSLISDVLDISKIEAGQLKVEHEPFDLRESILKVVRSVRPLAEKKGLDLSCDVAEEVGSISGDARRVEQVLLNLLSNALKFTEQGEVRVSCVREGGNFLTSVTDTGIGITIEEQEHLFKPFHQVDTGLSRKYEGTGLGLSISRKLVELMGGEIRVESSPGRGSAFGFTLPREPEPTASQPPNAG